MVIGNTTLAFRAKNNIGFWFDGLIKKLGSVVLLSTISVLAANKWGSFIPKVISVHAHPIIIDHLSLSCTCCVRPITQYIHIYAQIWVQIMWHRSHSERWKQWVKKRKTNNVQSSRMVDHLSPFSTSQFIHRDQWFLCGLCTTRLPKPK